MISRRSSEVSLSTNGNNSAIGFGGALQIPGVIEFSLCLFFSKLVSYTFLYWLPNYIEHSSELLSGLQYQFYRWFMIELKLMIMRSFYSEPWSWRQCHTVNVIRFWRYIGSNCCWFLIGLQWNVGVYLFSDAVNGNPNVTCVPEIRCINLLFEYVAIIFAWNPSEWSICIDHNVCQCGIGPT